MLLLASLRLLHNLSFDTGLQDEMIKQGLLPKVSTLFALFALFWKKYENLGCTAGCIVCTIGLWQAGFVM